jgi:uncharacterized protein (DUF362 family)/Pyruvate/2-oxoacid:ferredoxin oxidoreductase delta subunit
MGSSVSIVKCKNYDEEKVLSALRQAIDLIGGIQAFVNKDSRVLLKPNLLYGKTPENAVTTHPSIVRGMIQIVREAGGVPFIGDSPSIGGLMRTAEKAGIKAVADEMKCPLVEFNRPALPAKWGGKIFKQLEIDQAVLDADVIINLPKWKTHAQMVLTLGVKNLFGCVPGPRKPLWHLRAGESQKAFAQILLDIYRVIQPSLTILDGVVGMEGNGPGSGDPIPLGLILASNDALSIDLVVCDLLGIPRKSIPTNQVALEDGMTTGSIEVVGESIEASKVSAFELPPPSGVTWNLPGFARKALKNALTSKPWIDDQLCEDCERCAEICPAKALKKTEKGLTFDYGECIRCFCCQEVCSSGAISIKPGWALKMVGSGQKAGHSRQLTKKSDQ